MYKVAVIIPCFNEEASISKVIKEIDTLPVNSSYQLLPVVVNDCSTDNTLEILKLLNCIYLNLPINLGIGGAVQTGFKYAFRNGYDIVVQFDGDGQHPAQEISNLITPILAKECDVVIGSRFLIKEGFQSTFLRRAGIYYFKTLNRIFTGINITDSTSGFRAINKRALEIVSNAYPDDYPEPAAIVQYTLNNLKIKEIPVVMRNRIGGISSIRSSRQLYYMVKVTLSIFFLFIKLKFYGKRDTG